MNTKKRRAVVYARVSTDKIEQETSIQNQRVNLQRLCERNNWQIPAINAEGLCDDGIYYDIGTSGTKLSRPAFDRLLLDAGLVPIVDADTDKKTTAYKIEKPSLFDLVVVKDASRFSRNVSVNSILQTLKDNQVFVYFTDLNMSTEVNEHWSIIQQFFIFSENESRRKSTAVSAGYEAGLRQGKIYYGGKLFGYDYDRESNSLVINEKEAAIIRRVFDLYTEEDQGQYRICKRLAEEGYFNSVGKQYGRSTIKRWLENEKYCGTTTGGRYHKTDLFSTKREERDYDHKLRAEARLAQKKLEEQGIVKIPAIITREQFEKARQITAHNSELYSVKKEWHGTTDYSKKIVCGCCGAYYRASGRKYRKEGEPVIRKYVCKHHDIYDELHGISKCQNPSIFESDLDRALFGMEYWYHRRRNIEDLLGTGGLYLKVLQSALNRDNIAAVQDIEQKISDIKAKRERLLDLYADGIFDKEEITKRTAKFSEEINLLEMQKEQLCKNNNDIEADMEQVRELLKAAEEAKDEVNEIIEGHKPSQKTRKELLRDVDHITINAQGRPQIVFKSLRDIETTLSIIGNAIETYSDIVF